MFPRRGTAVSSRALTLASDAFLLPVVVELNEHTQFCVAGIGINLFSGTSNRFKERAFGIIENARTSSCLAIPTYLYLRKKPASKKKHFRVIGPKVLTRLVFPGIYGFRAFFFFFGERRMREGWEAGEGE